MTQSQSPLASPTPEQERQLFEALADPYKQRAFELRAAVYGFEALVVNEEEGTPVAGAEIAYVRPAKVPEFYEIESVGQPAEPTVVPAASKREALLHDSRAKISNIFGSQN